MAATNWLPVIALLLLIASVSACARRNDHTSPSGATASAPAKHEHKAPHAGTAVVLGQEAYHLYFELVRDAIEGKLTAYVLDGEMENFIRVKAPAFEIVAVVDGAKRPLALNAVANTATGETVGDTAQFEAQAEWLKTHHDV